MARCRWISLIFLICSLAVSGVAGIGSSQVHHVPLTTLYHPQFGNIGLVLKARATAGPPLRLLVDSGADHLTLDSRAARKSGLVPGESLDVVGAGPGARQAHFTTGRIEIGDLVFEDCPVVVVDGKIAEGIDGVVPLSLFSDFSIRLDIPRKALELYPGRSADEGRSGSVKVIARKKLLFAPVQLESGSGGYLLLDTGAAYNAISNRAAVRMGHVRLLQQSIDLTGGAGTTGGRMLPGPVSIVMGGRAMTLTPVISLDLDEVGRRAGVEVSGVLGYPALARSVLTVNYQEAELRIDQK
jgi:hypothetical protein